MEYPFDVPGDAVELMKDEYQMYRSRVLEHASGDVHVKFAPPAQAKTKDETVTSKRETTEDDNDETFDGHFQATEFAVRGSYRLDLEYCYKMPRVSARKRREMQRNMGNGYIQTALTALYNQSIYKFYTNFHIFTMIILFTLQLLQAISRWSSFMRYFHLSKML